RSGRLAAAAADVFETEPPGENPLLALPNFIATPHIAASTVEAQVSVAFDVAEEVAAVLAGDLPRFAVNAPALPPEELAYVRPFADLTERLAALHAQLFGGRVSAIELDFEASLPSTTSTCWSRQRSRASCSRSPRSRSKPGT